MYIFKCTFDLVTNESFSSLEYVNEIDMSERLLVDKKYFNCNLNNSRKSTGRQIYIFYLKKYY